MTHGEILRIFAALEAAGVRYLLVGGVAVVLHGHPRLTADVDLVVSLLPDNARATMKALAEIGYRPRPPVPAEDFADPEKRRAWIEEKGMRVFTLVNPGAPATEVDVFVEEPFPFEEAYARRFEAKIEGVTVPVASVEDLIATKRVAERPRDLEDIEALERIQRLRKNGDD